MAQPIRSRIYEGARLTLEQLQAIMLPIYAILTSTTTSGQDFYTVPNSKKLIISDILPHVATTVPSGESDSFGIFQRTASTTLLFNGGSPRDRLYAKAMNCRCTLEITNQSFQLFDRHNFALSDLMGPDGMFDEELPLVVPAGGQVMLNAKLQDSGAAGTSSQYGVLLVAALIPAEA